MHLLPKPLASQGVSADLAAIVTRAFAKNPIDRYAKIADFAGALRALLPGLAAAGRLSALDPPGARRAYEPPHPVTPQRTMRMHPARVIAAAASYHEPTERYAPATERGTVIMPEPTFPSVRPSPAPHLAMGPPHTSLLAAQAPHGSPAPPSHQALLAPREGSRSVPPIVGRAPPMAMPRPLTLGAIAGIAIMGAVCVAWLVLGRASGRPSPSAASADPITVPAHVLAPPPAPTAEIAPAAAPSSAAETLPEESPKPPPAPASPPPTAAAAKPRPAPAPPFTSAPKPKKAPQPALTGDPF